MSRPSLPRLASVVLTVVGGGVAAANLYRWFSGLDGFLAGSQFVSFYAAARLLIERGGAHVYDLRLQASYQSSLSHLYAFLPYIHPPYYTPLIAPLGLMDERTAYLAWGVVTIILAAAAIALMLATSRNLRGWRALPPAALAAASLPLFAVLQQGQSDMVMLLPLAGAYVAWSYGRQGWAGALSGLALVKPQLLILLPVLFIARRAWRALAAMAAVAVLLAVVALLVSGPQGTADYLRLVVGWTIGDRESALITAQNVSSLRGLFEHAPGGRVPALVLLAALLALIGLSLSWRPHVPRLDMALAIAASLALSPYQNLHDMSLLLIPAVAVFDLAIGGRLRWPAGLVIVALAYGAVYLGPTAALALPVMLAGYLVVERLAVRSDPIPLPDLEWQGPRPHRVIVLPAYRAARTLKETIEDIPAGHADRILLVDDASADSTVSVAKALKIDVIRHERNLGYGGNQKTCYRQALAMGADVVVMLHPDHQYDPAIIPDLCGVIERQEADLVLGSRWLGIDPKKAGMPVWKRLGNRFLTALENRVLGLELSEFHTGYRAYSRRFLEAVPFLQNSNDFVFDTQILIQAATFGFRIGEVPAVGRYFAEASSIGFRTSVVYGLKTLVALGRYVMHRAGFPAPWLTPASITHPRTGVYARPGTQPPPH